MDIPPDSLPDPLDRHKLLSFYQRLNVGYETALHAISRQLQTLLIREGINANVKMRVKTFDSFFEKLLRLQRLRRQLTINDLIALRVICPFVEDLGQAEELILRNFQVVEEERKSRRQNFREFGYDATHLLIELPDEMMPARMPYTEPVIEIQLRTILQEAWAEVEHELIYKSDYSVLKETVKRKLAALNAMLNLSDTLFQEIRDGLRSIEAQNGRRRETLREKLASIDEHFSLLDEAGQNQPAGPELPQENIDGPIGQLLIQALMAHSDEKFETAIELYGRILQMRPEPFIRSIVHNHRGMAWFVLSDYEKAIEDFNRSLELNAQNYRALNHRGLSFRVLGRHEEALQDFDASIVLNGGQVNAYYVRALIHFDLQDYASALESCERALNLRPDYVPAKRLKGMISASFSI
ncbi:tetratricopeptide repeat protein [Candidatus Sumerlaeota bacterium]|nr:tetratricopeptide repeat protein [Candidatus Sumerlaeota bacterium]